MIWQLHTFTYDSATNVLSGPNGQQLLEPKPSALLAYFIDNARRDISRDELIEHVWQGHIVSDGAINRVVVQLRKALNDNEKIKRFIVTVPKTGYRFIPTAQAVEDTGPTHNDPKGLGFRKAAFAIALVLFASIAAFFIKTGSNVREGQSPAMPRVSPLVRLSDEQFGATISPDGNWVVFSVRTETGAVLMLSDGTAVPPVPVGQTEGYATSAAWSPDGRGFVYQYRTKNGCSLIWLPVASQEPSESLYECPNAGQMSLAFSADGKTLYFTERTTSYDPAELFALDVGAASKRRVSQPAAKGRGNHHIDVHPVTGAILLLSDHAAGQTSAYAIDPSASTFERMIEWPYRLDQATWGHEAKTIVHPDMHPSYQLVQTDIVTGERQILATESRRIKEPSRTSDGQGYIYTSYLHNRDIWLNGSDATHLNSSVMDYAPGLSSDGERIAFISKRTGESRVFFDRIEGGAQSSVALPATGLSIFGVEWSDNDEYLMVASSRGIWVLNAETKQVVDHHQTNLPVYAPTWGTGPVVNYSQRENSKWQRYTHRVGEKESQRADDDWAFVFGSGSGEFQVSQTGTLWHNGAEVTELQCAAPLYGRHFSYRAYGGRVYCPSPAYDQILAWGAADSANTVGDFNVTLGQISISRDLAAHTALKATSSDIMRVDMER